MGSGPSLALKPLGAFKASVLKGLGVANSSGSPAIATAARKRSPSSFMMSVPLGKIRDRGNLKGRREISVVIKPLETRKDTCAARFICAALIHRPHPRGPSLFSRGLCTTRSALVMGRRMHIARYHQPAFRQLGANILNEIGFHPRGALSYAGMIFKQYYQKASYSVLPSNECIWRKLNPHQDPHQGESTITSKFAGVEVGIEGDELDGV